MFHTHPCHICRKIFALTPEPGRVYNVLTAKSRAPEPGIPAPQQKMYSEDAMLIVQKFGGSSLAGAERLRRAAGIAAEARRRGHSVLVVVSAMGDTTDELLDMAHEISSQPPARELDALISTGEQQSAALMAITLESMGLAARSFTGWQAGIITDGSHAEARIEMIAAGELAAALDRGEIAVVSGFQGVSPEGGITTLGRGGSDTTAVALAAALDAERCEIYTDVDGIYTADPRIVSGARRLEEIDFRDMLLLAGAGSQVLHDRSVALALANDVEIRLLSSFEPGRGSRVRLLADAERPDYAGVTRSEARSEITLVGRAAGTATLSELVIALSKSGIPVLSGSSGEGWVTVRVAPAQLIPALELTHTAYLKQRAE